MQLHVTRKLFAKLPLDKQGLLAATPLSQPVGWVITQQTTNQSTQNELKCAANVGLQPNAGLYPTTTAKLKTLLK